MTNPDAVNPTQEAGPEITDDLSTKVISLPDARFDNLMVPVNTVEMATQFTDFLKSLKEQGIDRTKTTTLATFKSPIRKLGNNVFDQQGSINTELSVAIIRAAAEAGLDIAIVEKEYTDGRLQVSRSAQNIQQETPGKTNPLKQLFQRVMGPQGPAVADRLVNKPPDYYLKLGFKPEPYTPGSIGLALAGATPNELSRSKPKIANHTIGIYEPDPNAPIQYSPVKPSSS